MLSIRNVSKSYHGGSPVLDNLSLEVMPGELFGFLGPNGAGKTTTIRLITGILDLDQGEIELNGCSIQKQPLEAKRQFGFVPDQHEFFLRLKGIEYVTFLADLYGVPITERKAILEELADRFEMQPHLGQPIGAYSHGMKKKISIIGAMIHRPRLLILDEPMTGLDPKANSELKKIMKEYTQTGRSVFYSTHILETAEHLCDKIAILHKGKRLFSGTMEELRTPYHSTQTLEEIFLELTR
ncbi:ABC transporter ATP-binding protein [Gorillibacterium sp. sgz500922]|uniref:ABC transporter ATP-binding protein n=1 Tax=Gorillibacterium sp. sgz500922 TaxID=3446694 RepID=UPI003F672564